MMRFISWLISLLLLIGLLLTATVALARQDRTPGMLQRIGYMVCDGHPCFRGVTLGLTWQEARDILQTSATLTISRELNIAVGESNPSKVTLVAVDSSLIDGIYATQDNIGIPLDIKLGEIMLTYGPPCSVARVIDAGKDQFLLVYPSMVVYISSSIIQLQSPAPIVTFHPSGHIDDLLILINGLVGDCNGAPFRLWHGFASSKTYPFE